MLELRGELCGGNGMSNMIGIEKRDQDIDVEQRTHSVRILFAKTVYLFVRNEAAPTLERHEAANSTALRFSRGSRERPAR
jgi:hypothetical protein